LLGEGLRGVLGGGGAATARSEVPSEVMVKRAKTDQKSHLAGGLAGGKPFACNKCTYRTAQKGHLIGHMRTHTGVKPYACDKCTYRAALSHQLKRHMRGHSGVKPYACKKCPYRTAQKGHLKRHMRTHMDVKPFTCSVCTYRAARRGHIRVHMRTHTGVRPYACEKCTYRGVLPHHLTRHMRTHTRNPSAKKTPASKVKPRRRCAEPFTLFNFTIHEFASKADSDRYGTLSTR
jgi:uncharacterized Zn-finger protein